VRHIGLAVTVTIAALLADQQRAGATEWRIDRTAQFGRAATVALGPDGDPVFVGALNSPESSDGYVLKVSATDGAEVWHRTYPGAALDRKAMAANGDIVVLGSMDIGGPAQSFTVIRLRGDTGVEQWRFTIPTLGDDAMAARAAAFDGDGNVVVVGTAESSDDPASGENMTVVKLDPDGALLWRVDLMGTTPGGEDYGAVLTVDAAGDVLAGGSIDNAGTGHDFALVKLSGSDGSEQWRYVLDGTESDVWSNDYEVAYTADVLPDGTVVASGRLLNATTGIDSVVVKVDASSGAELWRFDASFSSLDLYERLVPIVDPSGDLLLTGEAYFDADAASDIIALRLSGTDGSVVWQRALTELGGSAAHALRSIAGGNLVIVGSIGLLGATGDDLNAPNDVGVLELSGSTGATLRLRRVRNQLGTKGTGDDIAVTASGDYIVAASMDAQTRFTGMRLDATSAGIGLPGRKLQVVTSTNPSRNKIVLTAVDPSIDVPAPGSLADPNKGATLYLRNPGTGETLEIALNLFWPAGKPTVGGYRFRSPGTCRKIDLFPGRLKLTCKGPGIGYTLDEASQGELEVELRTGGGVGDERRCVRFGGLVQLDVPGRFKAKTAPATASCATP